MSAATIELPATEPGLERLDPPCALRRRLPVPPAANALVARTRHAVRAILGGRDPRLLAIVGPCSIHDPSAALEYGQRLARVAFELSNDLVVVMRSYFEKPRSTVGWKGMLNDPDLDGSCHPGRGIERARSSLLALHAIGMPCATELLDPLAACYLHDLLSWGAIGARTSASQIHRELASGLALPIGFKNDTAGEVAAAVGGVIAARQPHSALSIDDDGRVAWRRTTGNADGHIVLRGGASGPNYDAASVARAAALVHGEELRRPVVVDCSHDNSGKQPNRQSVACRAVRDQVQAGAHEIAGVMLESNLKAGRQDWRPGLPLERGLSITDACIGWDETAGLLHELAAATRARRGASGAAIPG